MKTLSRTCAVAGCAALLLASAGAAVTGASATGAAATKAASVTVPEEGTLVADGAGVSLSVAFDCQAGWTGGVSVDAAQTVRGHRLATGSAFSADVDCADGEESVDVTAMGAGDFAFTDGEALVRVTMFSCDATSENCENTDATGVVQFMEDSND
ncbi:MAG: hypothetical protein QJR09_05825 [Micrococcus sp.]|nr:hypothetical protein [Micrococcus sp.]